MTKPDYTSWDNEQLIFIAHINSSAYDELVRRFRSLAEPCRIPTRIASEIPVHYRAPEALDGTRLSESDTVKARTVTQPEQNCR